jgi:hypothetical protein
MEAPNIAALGHHTENDMTVKIVRSALTGLMVVGSLAVFAAVVIA